MKVSQCCDLLLFHPNSWDPRAGIGDPISGVEPSFWLDFFQEKNKLMRFLPKRLKATLGSKILEARSGFEPWSEGVRQAVISLGER